MKDIVLKIVRDDESLKLLQAIVYTLGIIAYVLMIRYYLPKSSVWARAVRTFGALKSRLEGHRIPAISYSLRYEVPSIVLAGLLLNLAGWGITSRNPHILYLDMAGTAAAAFLLGPWWGAIVGILTPFVVAAIYPSDAGVILVPWVLVNLSGGIFWGLMARRNRFRQYVNREPTNILSETKSHLSFLFWFGVVGAAVMAVAGATVSIALNDDPSIFARSPYFAEELQKAFVQLNNQIQSGSSAGSALIALLLRSVLRWGVTTFRYIPDKTISAAVGLLTAKYVFPLFERTLIRSPKEGYLKGDNWLTPALGLTCYATLLPWSIGHSAPAPWLWYVPIIIFVCACLFEFFFGGKSKSLIEARSERVNLYLAAQARMPREQYFGAIVIAVLVASLVFMLGLTIVGSVKTRGTVAFFFLGTVLTYCIAFYVMRVSMRQWVALLSQDHSSYQATTNTSGNREDPG